MLRYDRLLRVTHVAGSRGCCASGGVDEGAIGGPAGLEGRVEAAFGLIHVGKGVFSS